MDYRTGFQIDGVLTFINLLTGGVWQELFTDRLLDDELDVTSVFVDFMPASVTVNKSGLSTITASPGGTQTAASKTYTVTSGGTLTINAGNSTPPAANVTVTNGGFDENLIEVIGGGAEQATKQKTYSVVSGGILALAANPVYKELSVIKTGNLANISVDGTPQTDEQKSYTIKSNMTVAASAVAPPPKTVTVTKAALATVSVNGTPQTAPSSDYTASDNITIDAAAVPISITPDDVPDNVTLTLNDIEMENGRQATFVQAENSLKATAQANEYTITATGTAVTAEISIGGNVKSLPLTDESITGDIEMTVNGDRDSLAYNLALSSKGGAKIKVDGEEQSAGGEAFNKNISISADTQIDVDGEHTINVSGTRVTSVTANGATYNVPDVFKTRKISTDIGITGAAAPILSLRGDNILSASVNGNAIALPRSITINDADVDVYMNGGAANEDEPGVISGYYRYKDAIDDVKNRIANPMTRTEALRILLTFEMDLFAEARQIDSYDMEDYFVGKSEEERIRLPERFIELYVYYLLAQTQVYNGDTADADATRNAYAPEYAKAGAWLKKYIERYNRLPGEEGTPSEPVSPMAPTYRAAIDEAKLRVPCDVSYAQALMLLYAWEDDFIASNAVVNRYSVDDGTRTEDSLVKLPASYFDLYVNYLVIQLLEKTLRIDEANALRITYNTRLLEASEWQQREQTKYIGSSDNEPPPVDAGETRYRDVINETLEMVPCRMPRKTAFRWLLTMERDFRSKYALTDGYDEDYRDKENRVNEDARISFPDMFNDVYIQYLTYRFHEFNSEAEAAELAKANYELRFAAWGSRWLRDNGRYGLRNKERHEYRR
ncbi:MAG: hypothetical protein LBT88_06420 [Oscillospiraceae bacterium]|nr:hypothetical protein [Oscillospiraceae bacterium]